MRNSIRARHQSVTSAGKQTILSAAIAATLVAPVAFAEGTPAGGLEEVTVTATRQAENLQDVAIAVSAFSDDALEKNQIQSLGDIESFVPNLTLHEGDAGNAVIYIRGVGQIDSISFNDPGVGVYIDDVYMGRAQGSFLDVLDPQQIEVLRGPQGTLYGRNTIGGAVKFTSKKPTPETEGYVKTTVGNFGQQGIKGSINGALIEDVLAARFVVSQKSRDGYTKNLFDGGDDYDKDTFAWRAALQYTPNDKLTAYLTLDASDANPDHSRTPHRETPIYSLSAGGFVAPQDDPFTVNANYNDKERLETQGAALTLEYAVGDLMLKSITSHREMNYRTHLDLDGTTDSSFGIYNFEDQSQNSQEFQLVYSGEAMTLVSGLYYFREKDLSFGGAVAPDFFVPLAPDFYFPWPFLSAGERDQLNTSKAAYANLSFDLSADLGVTLGGRFTQESKSVTNLGEQFAGTGIQTAEEMEKAFGTGVGFAATGYEAEEDWNAFSPKVSLDYHASDRTLLYASASRGFKSGGFNGRLTTFAQPFDPEELWSYEAGMKTQLADDRVRLNVATFYNDYENFQLSRFSVDPDTGAFLSLFENAGRATMYGAELELAAAVTENLGVNITAGYLDGGYDELIGDFDQEISDQRELVNSPKWNSRISVDYLMTLEGYGSLNLIAGYSYRTKSYLTVSSSEALAQDSYGLLDASLQYLSPSEHWEASLFAKNLTDERYREHGFDLSASPGVQLGYYGAPRTYGINLGYRF